MAKAPAFQLYAADFYMDTLDWSAEEVGIYFRLLNYAWINGWIRADRKKQAQVAQVSVTKMKRAWRTISAKFERGEDGNLRNPRMERERAKQLEYRELCAEAGKKGGRPPKRVAKGYPFETLKGSESSPVFSLQSSSSNQNQNHSSQNAICEKHPTAGKTVKGQCWECVQVRTDA